MATTHELAKRMKSKRAAIPKRPPNVLADKSMKSLLEEAESKSVTGGWFPFQVPGDAIGGRVLSVKEEDGKYGPQTVLTLETPDGPRMMRANESLKREVEGVKKGDRIVVMFREYKTTGRGRPFKVFAVARK